MTFDLRHAFKPRHGSSLTEYMQNAPTSRFPRGTTLYNAADTAERVFYLHSGLAKLYATSKDGVERTIRIVYPGDLVGEPAVLSGRLHTCSCKCLSDVTVSCLSREQFVHLAETDRGFNLGLLGILAEKVLDRTQATCHETFFTLQDKVAMVLLDLISNHPEVTHTSGGDLVRVTHQEIANLLGTNRVSVTKVLNVMARAKQIVTARNCILVPDPKVVEEMINAPVLAD